MVHLSALTERLALDSRQLLGGDGLLGGLFSGNNDNEETTTSVAASGNPTRTSATATATSQTSAPTSQSLQTSSTAAVPTASRPPTVPSDTTSVPAATVTQSTVASVTSSIASVPPFEETTLVSAAPQTQNTPAPEPVVTVFTQNGEPVTITSTSPLQAVQTGEPAIPSAVGGSKSFLENKPLSGAIFGVAGLLGLIALIFLITLIVRKRRNKQLVDEAVSFDPSSFASHRSTDIERNTINNEKAYYGGSESGHGHGAVLPPTTYQAYDYNQGYGATSPSAAYYASAASGYNQPQQNWGYNNNPVQLPSNNMGGMNLQQTIPRVAPPSIHGRDEYSGPASASTANGYSLGGPPGIPVNRTPSPLPAAVAPGRRASDNGSVLENPYLAAQDYKVANV